MEVVSNQYVDEGTASTDLLITFPLRARHIEITNDSAIVVLQYKLNASQDYATLKPLEAVVPRSQSTTVILNGTGPYRVRAEG